jgi:hypothetical protein
MIKSRDSLWETFFNIFSLAFAIIIFFQQFIVDMRERELVVYAELYNGFFKGIILFYSVVHVMKEELFEVPFHESFEQLLVLGRHP